MLFSIQGNFSVNRKDLQPITLAGPTRENLVLDPPSCTTPQQLTINDGGIFDHILPKNT